MENNFDPASYFQKFFQNMVEFGRSFDMNKAMPNYNLEKMQDLHQHAINSSNSINQMMNEKAQAILSKQSEMWRKNTEIIMSAVKEISQNSMDSNKIAEKQSQLYKESLMNNMQHAQELSELCAKANLEIFNKCMSEMQDGIKKCADTGNCSQEGLAKNTKK